jgi:hypothetical protein
MALIIKDRVQETTTTTGTGAVSLGGAVTNFVAFSAVMANADTTYYAIISSTEWEVGLGTYATSGNTLARTTVYASSNAGALVNFAAGTKYVYVDAAADRILMEAADGSIASATLSGTTTFSGTIAGTPSVSTSSSLATQIVTVNLGTFANNYTSPTNGASGTGSVATVTWAYALAVAPAIGSHVTIVGMTPTGYNGTYTVTASTTTSVSFANATSGGVSVQGTIFLTDWAPVYSQSFSVAVSSTLWNAAGYVTGSAYGAAQPIVYAGNAGASINALGDELEMDGLTVSASLGTSPNINVYVASTSSGPVVGPRQIALQLY